MAVEIPLEPLPNQAFSIDLAGLRYDLTIKAIDGEGMAVTVVRNGALVVNNARCVAGSLVIGYRHLELGDFIFYTADDALPYYTDFGSTCGLVFYPADELGALRGNA